VQWYLKNSLPSTTATETDSVGSGGAVNVPAGAVTVTATLVATKRTIGAISAVITAGGRHSPGCGSARTDSRGAGRPPGAEPLRAQRSLYWASGTEASPTVHELEQVPVLAVWRQLETAAAPCWHAEVFELAWQDATWPRWPSTFRLGTRRRCSREHGVPRALICEEQAFSTHEVHVA